MTASVSRQRRVLLVDDEEPIRAIFGMALEDEGYHVLEADSAAAARAVIDAETIDVAVLDKNLPGGESGLDVLRYITEKQPNVSALILTGYASTDSAIDALRLGAFDYLKKPVDLDVFIEKVQRAMKAVAQSDGVDKLLEAMGEGVIVLGGDARIRTINGAGLELLGVGASSVVGRPIREFLLRFEGELNDVTPLVGDGERLLRCDNGERVVTHWNGKPLPDAFGGRPGLVAVVKDISAQKEIEHHLRSAKQEAERIAGVRSALLANVSHELRTPINGILGASDLMLASAVDEEQREQLEIINGCSRQLQGLINDILDFSKLEASGVELDRHWVDLRSLVTSAVRLFGARAEEKGVALITSFDERLPDNVIVDELRVRQVVLNLLSNAVKFTKQGHVEIEVRVQPGDGASLDVAIAVSDTGIGVPDAKRELIFDPFTQADASTTRNFGGTGLGLAICRQLAALMHGSVMLDAHYRDGARFSFTFRAEAAGPAAAPKPESADLEVRGRRALVVDDNAVNRKVGGRMLERLGFDVALANDGCEAVECVQREHFDLVMMDFQMPRMDGITATRHIRERLERGPIIVGLTANTSIEDREACFTAGMDDYLNKPLGLKELATVLSRWFATGVSATMKAG